MVYAAIFFGILIFALVVGSFLNFAAPFIAIPLFVIALSVFGARDMLNRQRKINQMRRFRREARARKTEFTPGDRKTVV